MRSGSSASAICSAIWPLEAACGSSTGRSRRPGLIFALDAGVTLERIADPDGLPTEVLDDLVSGLTEPI